MRINTIEEYIEFKKEYADTEEEYRGLDNKIRGAIEQEKERIKKEFSFNLERKPDLKHELEKERNQKLIGAGRGSTNKGITELMKQKRGKQILLTNLKPYLSKFESENKEIIDLARRKAELKKLEDIGDIL